MVAECWLQAKRTLEEDHGVTVSVIDSPLLSRVPKGELTRCLHRLVKCVSFYQSPCNSLPYGKA